MGLEPSGWRILRTAVVGFGMLAGLIGAGLLVLAGLSYVVADAVFERRWPWLTVPATAAGGAIFLWVIVHLLLRVDALLRRLRLTGQEVGEILRGIDTSSRRSFSGKRLLQKIPPDRLIRGGGGDPLRQLR